MQTVAARPQAPRRRLRFTWAKKQALWGFVFALPALILFALFSFIPIARTFYFSFFRYDMLTPATYVGLHNFQSVLSDPTFGQSVVTTVIYVLGTYVPTLAVALLFALALNMKIKARAFFRTVYFVPVVMSMVVVTVIWRLMFQHYGLINVTVLNPLHIGTIDWLNSETYAPIGLILMSIWKELGFYIIIFLAGLQNIPSEYYEAAKVDGAKNLAAFRHITLPLLQPTILFASIMAMINGAQIFIPQYVMTSGGPVNATNVLALNIYQTAFVYLLAGKAAAMSVLLFVFLGIISAVQFRFYRSSQ
jgi:multiple sugar transport system permease protein